jgi:hypothetical protein
MWTDRQTEAKYRFSPNFASTSKMKISRSERELFHVDGQTDRDKPKLNIAFPPILRELLKAIDEALRSRRATLILNYTSVETSLAFKHLSNL